MGRLVFCYQPAALVTLVESSEADHTRRDKWLCVRMGASGSGAGPIWRKTHLEVLVRKRRPGRRSLSRDIVDAFNNIGRVVVLSSVFGGIQPVPGQAARRYVQLGNSPTRFREP